MVFNFGDLIGGRCFFYPRDAMRKRGLCCRSVSVRSSVRLSHWCIVSTQLKISSNFLFGPVDPSLLFFWSHAPIPNSKATPSTGRKIHGGGENWQLSTEIAVYLGNGARQADGYNGTLLGSHMWRIDPCRFRRPDRVIFDPDFKVTTFFEVEYLKKRCVLGIKLL